MTIRTFPSQYQNNLKYSLPVFKSDSRFFYVKRCFYYLTNEIWLLGKFCGETTPSPDFYPCVTPVSLTNHIFNREEWAWLKRLESGGGSGGSGTDQTPPTAAQLAFHWSVSSAARILLDDLRATTAAPDHRLFTWQVVQAHSDVSFLLLLPPHADVCSAPGHQWAGLEEKRGCFALPVPMFEIGVCAK